MQGAKSDHIICVTLAIRHTPAPCTSRVSPLADELHISSKIMYTHYE